MLALAPAVGSLSATLKRYSGTACRRFQMQPLPLSVEKAAAPKLNKPELAGLPDYELIPHTSMRRTIARRLTESKQTVPHFYLTVDVELDNLLEARKQINANAPDGVKVSVNDFVIKAAAMALMRVPDANAAYTEEGLLEVQFRRHFGGGGHPGRPDHTDHPGAHTKGLAEISAEMADLAKRAREGKLKPMEFTGGTFSHLQPGHVRHQAVRRRHQPAAGRDHGGRCGRATAGGEERCAGRGDRDELHAIGGSPGY